VPVLKSECRSAQSPVVLSINYENNPNEITEDTRTYPDDNSSGLIASADLEICSLAKQELEEVIGSFSCLKLTMDLVKPRLT
jgi:hypothetical protein